MVSNQELAYVILIGMLFAFFLCYTIIVLSKRNRQVQEISLRLVQEVEVRKDLEKLSIIVFTQDEERNRIARVLHDEIGAILSLAHRNLSNVLDKTDSQFVHYTPIELSRQYVANSIEQLRTVSKGLSPQYLLKFGLAKALKKMAYLKTEILIDNLEFTSSISEDLEIQDDIATHVFYIVSELLTNLIKHGFPSKIAMNMDSREDRLYLKIAHNGIALSQHDYNILLADSDGLGLKNIGYRLSLIQGDISFTKFDSYGIIKLDVKFK